VELVETAIPALVVQLTAMVAMAALRLDLEAPLTAVVAAARTLVTLIAQSTGMVAMAALQLELEVLLMVEMVVQSI
jgi:hypothetical protein